MPITAVTSDPQALTLTLEGEYPVPLARLWEAWADPRQLEKFWGPPTWPATFTRHDMTVGGRSEYFMTGPDGSQAAGWWRVEELEPGRLIRVVDGFANSDGTENHDMPTMQMVITFEATATGSRFTNVTHFPSIEAMEKLVGMGMLEGMRSAVGQLDALLADLASFAATRPTESQILNDTQVRICRVIRGTVDQVWRAHHEPALLQRWLLGPDGWTMPVCQVASQVGETWRYEWESLDGAKRFGFAGELLESSPPHRAVTTEQMLGMDGPGATNVLTLTPLGATTLLTLVVTYPSAAVRDMVLATGMVGGMELSYARLEAEVLVAA